MLMSVLSRSLFDKYTKPVRPALLQYARARCGPAYAEDLVQDALCRAWSLIARFDNPDRIDIDPQPLFARWLSSIQARVCDEWVRQQARRPELLLPLDILQVMAEQGQVLQLDAMIAALMWDKINRTLKRCKLTPRQRTCLLRWLDGESQPQIARALSISYQAVNGHVQAAIARLQRADLEDIDVEVLEVLREVCRATVYHRPQRVGAALAVEKLRRMR